MEAETLFSKLLPPTFCSNGEQKFQEIGNLASKHNIPAAYQKNYNPATPRETSLLIQQRDDIRKNDPQDPQIDQLNQQISATISSASKQAWLDKLDSANLQTNTNQFWSIHHSLSGKRPHLPPNQSISFGTKAFTKTID